MKEKNSKKFRLKNFNGIETVKCTFSIFSLKNLVNFFMLHGDEAQTIYFLWTLYPGQIKIVLRCKEKSSKKANIKNYKPYTRNNTHS